jgi:hypothetical protein
VRKTSKSFSKTQTQFRGAILELTKNTKPALKTKKNEKIIID